MPWRGLLVRFAFFLVAGGGLSATLRISTGGTSRKAIACGCSFHSSYVLSAVTHMPLSAHVSSKSIAFHLRMAAATSDFVASSLSVS